jgi:hypothetical protein
MPDRSPRERFLEVLLSKVDQDHYPSTSQMDMLERNLDRRELAAYVDVLADKIEEDQFPSVPMMQRIERLLGQLPRQR